MRITNDDYKPSLLDPDELAHYGVKGMKWGVRRDQATLDRAAGRTKKKKKDRKEIKEAQRKERSALNTREVLSDPNASVKTKDGKEINTAANREKAKNEHIQAKKELDAVLKKHGMESASNITPGHPVVFLGLLATFVAVRKVQMFRDSGRKDAKEMGDKEFNKKPELSNKMSVKELEEKVVKQVNPDYPAKGTQMNCRRATFAYEMRRRGNDVKATESKYASGQDYKGVDKALNAEVSTLKKSNSVWGEDRVSTPYRYQASNATDRATMVFDQIASHGDGARGELCFGWAFGGGHSIAWEVVDGTPVIFDTQNAKTFNTAADLTEYTAISYEAATTRLDNREINDEFIRRWVTNA